MRTGGSKGMGMHKHGTSGRATKSPRARFHERLEAERSEIKDRSRIKEPKASVGELFKGRR